ncbi:MAG: molybdenum ABC transporter ATP-binding protein [Acidobacteria bacterium]|jgi:molybdate transport system ATP-binding protein|nr:molybdenum ABC transporter ATP-binding protein [Acidobacteriota bacterium]
MILTAEIRTRLSPDFTLDVRFTAPPGITMLFGASGSGKTTLLRCLAGLHRPDAGRVTIGDRVVLDRTAGIDVAARERGLGYVFQHLALFPHMTVEHNLHYGLAHFHMSVRRERTREIAASFKIAHLLARKPGEISGGERQRVALARSLVTNPRLLLLDEPLSALDHVTKSRIIEDLRAWNAARGLPILYITHSHREVFALGEHVIALKGGRILAEGTPQEVLEMPAHEPLAQLAGFENFFDATVMTVRSSGGTMHCRLADSDAELEVPLARTTEGAAVRIAIRAGDILLAIEAPRGLSARNVLKGTLTSIQREGATMILMVQAGAPFEVHVTPDACESLSLVEGQPVWIVIKTRSCRIVSTGSAAQPL